MVVRINIKAGRITSGDEEILIRPSNLISGLSSWFPTIKKPSFPHMED
jgi:hypothetical protein